MKITKSGLVAASLAVIVVAFTSTATVQVSSAQSAMPFLVSGPQGQTPIEADRTLVYANGQQIQPYGFLWSGYNADVEYDIYGFRRTTESAFGCNANNPCGREGCATCGGKSHGFLNGVISSLTKSHRCKSSCNAKCGGSCSQCEKQSHKENENSSNEQGNDVVRVSPPVPVPTPADVNEWPSPPVAPRNDLPPIDQPPRDLPTKSAPVIAPDPSVEVNPVPDPPEPTLNVPTQPRLPRNPLPNLDASTINSPKPVESNSSRRSQRDRTLAAVGRFIQS